MMTSPGEEITGRTCDANDTWTRTNSGSEKDGSTHLLVAYGHINPLVSEISAGRCSNVTNKSILIRAISP
ncbi:hypothetical protein PAMP_016961 [Pampus punctatissimus]